MVDLIGNEVVEFSKEAVASIETMGVSPAQINGKVSNLFSDVPKQETYILTDATQEWKKYHLKKKIQMKRKVNVQRILLNLY